MSSGNHRDLTKAISKATSELSLPLPDHLLEIISIYLDKRNLDDELETQRLQDDLLTIYKTSVLPHPSRLAAFLTVLQKLRLALRDSIRQIKWWEQILAPIIFHLEVDPRSAVETRDILLCILTSDQDDDDGAQSEDFQTTSHAITEILFAKWLAKTKKADEDLDNNAAFVASQIQLILFEYGKKNPKNFLTTLNKFFIETETRISSLSLLCSFFRYPPPHLHQMLATPLFTNLLRCLQIDTSTRAVSLAMTALVMFLPHIPSTTSHHLPALFNIYTRILFWDRQKINEDGLVPMVKEEDKNMNIDGWKKLPCLLEFNDESVPQLLYYFTFLYGLYPINFMSYVRKPQKYLGHAKFSGTEEFEIQPWEVRQRSESFRQIHLLHPNFFTFTLESELTDNNRWRRSDAADVVAECMALYVPSEDLREQVLKHKGKKNNPESLFSGLLSLDEKRTPIPRIRRASWSDVRSKIGISTSKSISQPCFSRKFSLDTFPHVSLEGLSDSVAVPQTIGSTSSTELGFDRPPRSNIYLMNDAIASLALSNHHESQLDSYLESLSRVSKPTASTYNPEVSEPSSSISRLPYLYREIQLLKNDLNFERYLKQQHLSHIGQLRRKQIREARIEAETQNVITSNRTLKLKLEEAKRLNTQLKRESEKSKSHCRKWEAELSTKLRSLREEQRKWITERENLTQDLKIATQNIFTMRQIIVQTEARELRAQQKAAYAEGSLEELQQLRKEVKELNLRVRIFEVNEDAVKAAKKNEDTAEARVIMLEAELQARDREFVEAQKTFEQEISSLRKQSWSGPKSTSPTRQKLQDMSLAMPNTQIIELQKNYDQLLARYLALQNDFYNLQAYTSKRNDLDIVANNDYVS